MMRKRKHPIIRLFLSIFILICVVGIAVAGYYGAKGYKWYQQALSEMSLEDRVEQLRSNENYVKYDELPKFYIDATISVEDNRFMKHNGIDYIAVARAIIMDIKAGKFVQGGSSITQQVAKNLLFDQSRTIERKAAEVFAVADIEKDYTKEEIFEIYVNQAYFGSGYYGIYDAARGYFGKEPAALSDYECAMLAGLPNSPNTYSPKNNRDLAVQRTHKVIDSMVRHKLISEDEANVLKSIEESSVISQFAYNNSDIKMQEKANSSLASAFFL